MTELYNLLAGYTLLTLVYSLSLLIYAVTTDKTNKKG